MGNETRLAILLALWTTTSRVQRTMRFRSRTSESWWVYETQGNLTTTSTNSSVPL